MSNGIQQFISAYREMEELGCILWNDAKRAEAHLHDDSARRHFVRSVFAYIEGLVYRIKRLTIIRHAAGRSELERSELAMLHEETYDLDEKGVPQARPVHLSIAKNLRFTFAAYAKVWGGDFSLGVDNQGWNAFRSAIVIRNRLMHPKSVADLEISREEANTVKTCLDWFTDEFCRLQASCPPRKPGAESPPLPRGDLFKRGARFKTE